MSNAEHLERVSTRIGRAIVAFTRQLDDGAEFHADDLRRYVMRVTGLAAPGSADRVLRDLRQKGLLAYYVVDRRASLYRLGNPPGENT